jgi:P-type Ca2+ transporter type 2C
MQKKFKNLAMKLSYTVIFLTLALFFIGLFRNASIYEMLRLAIVLAVATIPEGLPIVVTVIMAIGMRHIFKANGLVKRLNSVEVLGSVSVICIDKTGTITEGKMKVVKTDLVKKDLAIYGSVLNNDRTRNLELALWDYAKKEKFDPEEICLKSPRLWEKPFDSEHKYSITINNIKGKDTAFALGAPEIVLDLCKVEGRKEIKDKINAWAIQGFRVAGIASKDKGDLKEEKNYEWLGLFAVEDPLRSDAKETIETAQKAGIQIKIVTGDYRQTAEKIATNLGFHIDKNSVMEGEELEKISDTELKKRIMDIVLFARATPHQKLKIVRVLQELGERVAMTGDGVNDAPALKKANIGVVVGSNATEVAKEAGDIILLDSNLKTIVSACKEGRLIFLNIKRAVTYILSNSFTKMMVIFGAMLFNLPFPLTVIQILLVHMVCDGPPDIVLAFEPSNGNIMKEKPVVYAGAEILPNSKKLLVLLISVFTSLATLSIFWYFSEIVQNLTLARTLVFAIISSISLIYIFSFKDLEIPILKSKHFLENKILFAGIFYGFMIILASIYLPFANRYLGTTPLNISHWLIVILIGLGATLLAETSKTIKFSR